MEVGVGCVAALNKYLHQRFWQVGAIEGVDETEGTCRRLGVRKRYEVIRD